MPIVNASDFMPQYAPKSISPEDWAKVRDFTTLAVTSIYEEASDHQLRLAARSVARLALDALSYGRELTNEDVFEVEFIEFHCNTQLAETTTMSSVRALLTRFGRALSLTWGGNNGTVSYPTSMKNVPYTQKDVETLHSWAKSCTTKRAKENAFTLLALGLGAGLRNSEVDTLTVADVERTRAGLVIHPAGYRGAAERYVPVRRDYEHHLQLAIADLDATDFVFLPGKRKCGSKAASDFVKRMPTPRVAVTLSRMRATWIVGLMGAHVPEAAICDAAGLADLQHYARYREIAGAASAESFDRQIRYAGVDAADFPPLTAI